MEIRDNKTHSIKAANIFTDILSPMIQREGSSKVYFYRIIGCDDAEQYFAEILQLDEKLRSMGNYLFFDQKIPITSDSILIDRVRILFEQVPLKDFSNGAVSNLLDIQGYFSLSSDFQINRKIKDAFGIVLNLYLSNDRPVNVSIVVNFVTKLLLWFVDYGKYIVSKSSYNPKLIYWGSPKTHEVYFLIFMSLNGCDVLVLNTSFIDRFNLVDKQNVFSFVIKNTQELSIPTFPIRQVKAVKQTPIEQPTKAQLKPKGDLPINLKALLIKDPIIVVKLKRSNNPFEEVLIPLDKRSGYVGGTHPIVPVHFVRYIGVPSSTDDWETEYYNKLYTLDKVLQTSSNYLKFLEGIPAPSTVEGAHIPPEIINNQYKDQLGILEQILQAKILPHMNNELIDNTIRKTFVDIVDLFTEKSGNINLSIVLNFSLKLVTWFNRYLPMLFAPHNGVISTRAGFDFAYNPKVLFYGAIKPHEIYLLEAFHKLGCDVLFVHSSVEGDKPFQIFDSDLLLTYLINNKQNLSLSSFPESERLIRKSTIAYSASKEIEEVIYSEDVGLFKPWQFESYLTQPITLKTTYDELKILWQEPSKLRPEFRVQNKKVYVPNLFAKINGVNEDLGTYWQDLKVLISSPNTKLIDNIPFTKVRYTRQELYQTDYLLNEQGLFDEFKVKNSHFYRFGYLKADLQHFIIVKINELLLSEMFLTCVDEKFKLKILMTILTMDDSLIKLIEVFDFPQQIPKIVVYDYTKETLSEDDAILLAYFNLIGMDIVIFTPTNYETIEQQIKASLFDVYQLPLVKYDLILPSLDNISDTSEHKPGLLSRFFNLR